jgi:flagellar hook-associated protein 3 FlgL
MSALGQAVNGLLNQLIGIGNTQYAGAYVFAGDQVLSTPYSASGAYSGDSNSNSAILSGGTSLQLTFNGQAIFGDTTTGAIGTLTALANALNSGNQSAVAATLPQLQTALQQIAMAQSALGTTMNSASAETTNGNNQLTTLSSAISNVSQTDVAQAAVTVNEQLLQEQALVSLGSDLSRIPLINILV